MMREVIQGVIAAEAEAERLVDGARSEANQILADAKRQARELVARARQEARVEGQSIVDAAIATAEREKQEHLVQLTTHLEQQVTLDKETWEGAVSEALRCVCGKRKEANLQL